MELILIIKGLIIGISVSAPLGPIGIICLQKTLNKGVLTGFLAGMGAAFADTFYALIAGFGVSFISDFFVDQQFYLRGAGGALLIILGLKVFYTNTIKQVRRQRSSKGNIFGDFISVFFLTISNPITIIVFGAIFAGIGLAEEGANTYQAGIIVLGIFSGATLWWLTLAISINYFRHKIRLRSLWWINKIAGGIIAIIGLFFIVSLLYIENVSGV
ncbi:MAG: LysE family transporter [Bacteroidota bacterium]|nr:LysE family transporter [Bacteroidota bacterium]